MSWCNYCGAIVDVSRGLRVGCAITLLAFSRSFANENQPKSFSKNLYTFQWQDSSPDSIFNIKQAGNYYVKITDSFGCNITSDTVKITVDNFASIFSLGPSINRCAGNFITLTSNQFVT